MATCAVEEARGIVARSLVEAIMEDFWKEGRKEGKEGRKKEKKVGMAEGRNE